MGRKHFKPEQIIHMLREAEIKLAGGKTTGEVCRELGIAEQSYYRWRTEYGGMQVGRWNGPTSARVPKASQQRAMHVGFDETRQHDPAGQVDRRRAPARCGQDIFAATDRENLVARYC